ALKENPDPAKAKEITDILLTPYEGSEYTVQMGSIAYGCFADNFLPFMETADIEAMCDAYAARYDTSRMMPRQFDFLAKMCKILGRPKPKKKFFVR
ncbi:MAG: hypothetical protein HUJ75_08870, partial [Parasporobacterium sp.]|nr:hypothetical protein [Parasporobacterium sp.]